MKNRYKTLVVFTLLVFLTKATAQATDAAANEWPSYIAPLRLMDDNARKLSDPNDPQLRQELNRFMYSAIALGFFSQVYADPEYPDLYPVLNQAFNFFAPNPDDAYTFTPIDDAGVYKISGYRGTVHMVDFNIGSGELLTRGVGIMGPTKANYDIDKFRLGRDGWFEFILSPQRPAGYSGDWRKLEPGATFFLVRQISYDWLHEVDGRFTIERLDRPAIKPRESAEKIAARLKQIAVWAQNWTSFSFVWLQRLRDQGVINKVIVRDITDSGFMSTQRYIDGLFDLADDEALIYETEVPRQCRYWNIELTDEQWAAIDWTNRQSTLNGYTARVDRDGKFRAVISARDPGVPNWLDTGGVAKGEMFGRWNTCSSYPTPTLTKVKVMEVRKYLPADTPTVTAAARDASFCLRRKGAQLRRRW